MRRLLRLTLCFFVLISVGIACSPQIRKRNEEIRLHEKKIEESNRSGCVPGCMLFEGDSNMEMINFQEYFSRPVCNYARRGSTSQNLLARKDIAAPLLPDSIHVLVGGNDLLRSIPLAEIEKNYSELIAYYKTIAQKVYCISNLPVHSKFRLTNTDIMTLNKILEQVCKKQGATYLHLYPFLLKNGGLDPDYARDPVHLNKAGQDVLVRMVKQRLVTE